MREPPLDGPALRAALLDGLRFYALVTGSPAGDAVTLVEHQLAAIRSACKRVDPPNVRTRPPMRLATTEPTTQEEPPELPWWKRD